MARPNALDTRFRTALERIADAGHNIRRDQYDPFRTAVTSFLKETV